MVFILNLDQLKFKEHSLLAKLEHNVYMSETSCYIEVSPYICSGLIQAIRDSNINKLIEELQKIKLISGTLPLNLTQDIDSYGFCAMAWAIEVSTPSVIRLLIKYNVNFELPYPQTHETPLVHAVRLNKFDVVCLIADRVQNLNNGLIVAIQQNFSDSVNFLLYKIICRAFRLYQNCGDFPTQLKFESFVFKIAKFDRCHVRSMDQLPSILKKIVDFFQTSEEQSERTAVLLLEKVTALYYSNLVEVLEKKLPKAIASLSLEYVSTSLMPYYKLVCTKKSSTPPVAPNIRASKP